MYSKTDLAVIIPPVHTGHLMTPFLGDVNISCYQLQTATYLWTPVCDCGYADTLLCSLFPVYPTTTFYWLFFFPPVPEPHRCYQIGQLWPCGSRGFKRLIDTSWVLWESREFTALQLIELLRRGVAQIICKKKKSLQWKFRHQHPNEVRMKLTLSPELLTIA